MINLCIYNNGWNAAIIQLNADANPYDYPSQDWKAWDKGWKQAHELMSIRHQRIEHAN